MIDILEPYPAYRDSGVPWLGQVPEHWNMRRIKNFATVSPGKSQTLAGFGGDTIATILPMENVGTDGHINPSIRLPIADASGLTCFRRGDVIVAKITPCFENGKGACLDRLPTVLGFGSTEFVVLRPRREIRARYLYTLTVERGFRKVGAETMTGSAGQQRISPTFIGNYFVAVPEPAEQDLILRFLDHVERKIGRYIAAKRQLIRLLDEEKQAIILRAVTRGLNPEVRLKSSGIDWLGDIPEHWEVRPAKYYLLEIDTRSIYGDEELLSVSHKTGVTPRSQKNITMFMAESYCGHKICEPDDVVVNTMWGWMAAIGVSAHRGLVSPSYGVYRLRKKDKYRPRFLDLLLRIEIYRNEYVRSSRGITSSRLRLYPEQFLRIVLLCPPVDEQDAILATIDQEIGDVMAATLCAKNEIDLLNEFRTRLISDVVTGKVDVSAAAASLPEESADEWQPEPDEEPSDVNSELQIEPEQEAA